jgi:hypothetical protein
VIPKAAKHEEVKQNIGKADAVPLAANKSEQKKKPTKQKKEVK